jgi:hypothetical protein
MIGNAFPIARRSALDALTAGDVDLALGYFPTVGESMIASAPTRKDLR